MTDAELVAELRNIDDERQYIREAKWVMRGERILAADRIEQLVATNEQLTAERDRLRIALTDAESYLGKGLDKMAYNILRDALKGEIP